MRSVLSRLGFSAASGRMAAFVVALAMGEAANAQPTAPNHVERLNAILEGRLLDFTQNHGQDRRRYSNILGQPRDLYVYLPPGYSPSRAYPLVLWLHGAFGDEHAFLDQAELETIDEMILDGRLPPMIVACPDGTYSGENLISAEHSLYLNGQGGRVQDHLLCEVIPFLTASFSILPTREAHAVIGVSAGGAGALNLVLKHPEYFGLAAAIAGAANLRYSNVQGDYFADFDPAAFRWKTTYDPNELVARYLGGLISIRASRFIEPVFGADEAVVPRVMLENPADLLFRYPPPMETPILLCYGGRDQFNMDAQGASFAYLAQSQGVVVEVRYDPQGDHGGEYFQFAQQQALRWLAGRIAWPVEPR